MQKLIELLIDFLIGWLIDLLIPDWFLDSWLNYWLMLYWFLELLIDFMIDWFLIELLIDFFIYSRLILILPSQATRGEDGGEEFFHLERHSSLWPLQSPLQHQGQRNYGYRQHQAPSRCQHVALARPVVGATAGVASVADSAEETVSGRLPRKACPLPPLLTRRFLIMLCYNCSFDYICLCSNRVLLVSK